MLDKIKAPPRIICDKHDNEFHFCGCEMGELIEISHCDYSGDEHIYTGRQITTERVNELLQTIIDHIKSEHDRGVLLEARHLMPFIENLKS